MPPALDCRLQWLHTMLLEQLTRVVHSPWHISHWPISKSFMSSSACLLWTRGGNYLELRNLLLNSPFAGVYFSHVEILLSQLTVSWRAVDLWKKCLFRLWLKVLWGDMNSSSQTRGDEVAAVYVVNFIALLCTPALVRSLQVCMRSYCIGYKK